MVVPFGVSAGDFLAVLQLIHRIAAELKRVPESAVEYRDLLIELEALGRALKQLLSIKPVDGEAKLLDGIRSLAVTCQEPLEAFLKKIERFEHSLGSWNVNKSGLRGLHRRLQWSIMYKDEVTLLRSRLAPKISTITMLLLISTKASLTKAESDRHVIAKDVAQKLFGQNILLQSLKQTVDTTMSTVQSKIEDNQAVTTAKLEAQGRTIQDLQSKTNEILKQSETHEKHLQTQDSLLENLQENDLAISSQTLGTHGVVMATQEDICDIKVATSSLLSSALNIMNIVATGVSKVNEVIDLIRKLFLLTAEFTVEMREAVARLLRIFGEMQRRLTLIERYLPRQIDLPVVRFRDAFNDMRSLPYDLSRDWQTFRGLVAVVFANKQGLHRVNRGLYFITHARIGQRLRPEFWSNAIQPGDELLMTMILDDVEGEEGVCPWSNCRAITEGVEVTHERKRCPLCHRSFAILPSLQDKDIPQSSICRTEDTRSDRISTKSFSQPNYAKSKFNGVGKGFLPEIPPTAPELEDVIREDFELYHSIAVARASQKERESKYQKAGQDVNDIADKEHQIPYEAVHDTGGTDSGTKSRAKKQRRTRYRGNRIEGRVDEYAGFAYPLPGYPEDEYAENIYSPLPQSYNAQRHNRRYDEKQSAKSPEYYIHDPKWLSRHDSDAHQTPFSYNHPYFDLYRIPKDHVRPRHAPPYNIHDDVDQLYRSSPRSTRITREPKQTMKKVDARKKSVEGKATTDDALRAGIPRGYSISNWDPRERPILLRGSVFDANSIGKWIHDWTVYCHGSSTPIANIADELWLLLVRLTGRLKRSEVVLPRIRSVESRRIVEGFTSSGDCLLDAFSETLKDCESYMYKVTSGVDHGTSVQKDNQSFSEETEHDTDQAAVKYPKVAFEIPSRETNENFVPVKLEVRVVRKRPQEAKSGETQETMITEDASPGREERIKTERKEASGVQRMAIIPLTGTAAGKRFVDSFFGKDRLMKSTGKLIDEIRVWVLRFDVNCEDILSSACVETGAV